ncbi:cellulosome protein [Streptomyces roseirectus]|uniref:Cellulosome protein n=1 Tax=Streptomyces roseirectus TaxID=2768066 RepID=A0A7H0I814_9ACTN|nr:cellulosome protein [Streptomyces roseirectus]QNP68930.1 cellulosome protein [Streptomyces roseirectus]
MSPEPAPDGPAPDTLLVDLGAGTGPFHGGASGTLYGVYGDGVPSRSLIEGIRLRTVSTKAQDGVQHPGADALEILPSFVEAGGREIYVYIPDTYRGFPYEWPGATGPERLADLKARVRRQVELALGMGALRSHLVYVPFNEPEGNMFGDGEFSHDGVSWRTDPAAFFAAWREVHALIKELDPDARVAGPNTCLLYDEVRGFLEFARDADVLPDVITWHELSSPGEVRGAVAKYRALERELGIGPLPVNINEYAHNYHLSVPGQMIQWIAAIEESKVDADMAYWNIAGNLNDSAVGANRANGQWWLLHAYGTLTGDTVQVTAPHPDIQYTLQGVAVLDRERRQARVLFGGADGAAEVAVAHVDPAVFGTVVHARLEEIPWTGQLGASERPLLIEEAELPVTDDRVSLPLARLDAMSAYRLTLSPGGNGAALSSASAGRRRSYEAEDAAHTGESWTRNGPEGSPFDVGKFATSGGYHVGGLRTGSDLVLSFDVEAPQDGEYDVRIYANAYNKADLVRELGPTNAFLRVDGGQPREVLLPVGYQWAVWGHTDTRVTLTAGRHTLTLAAHDPDLGTTRGDAVIDRLDLIPRGTDAGEVAVYDAEFASLGEGARTDFTRPGASGPGVVVLGRGAAVTFWVHARDAGEVSATVERIGAGEGRLAVDGEDVGELRDGAVPLFLAGGISRVTVTATSDRLVVDRLLLGPSRGLLPTATYPAEEGVLTGTAQVTGVYPYATGGKAVDGVGGGAGNALTLTVTAERAGRHALTLRYSNGEQAPSTHYNPDPLCRHADLSVNGGEPWRVLFPTTFHFNNFDDLSLPVTLRQGVNTLTFTADELPDFDGTSYNAYGQRSAFAPVLDNVTVTPLA